MFARRNDELTVRAEFAFVAANRMLVEVGDGKVAIDRSDAFKPQLFEMVSQTNVG